MDIALPASSAQLPTPFSSLSRGTPGRAHPVSLSAMMVSALNLTGSPSVLDMPMRGCVD